MRVSPTREHKTFSPTLSRDPSCPHTDRHPTLGHSRGAGAGRGTAPRATTKTPQGTDACPSLTHLHAKLTFIPLLLTDEIFKNGFYVNSAAFVTDNVLTLNTTHDPNLTPPAPPPRAPACPVPSRRPGNLRIQVPTSNREVPFFTFSCADGEENHEAGKADTIAWSHLQ